MASDPKSSVGLAGAYYGPSIPAARTHRSVGRRSPTGLFCCCDPLDDCLLCSLLKLLCSILLPLGILLLILWLLFRPNQLKVSVEGARLASFDFANNTTLAYSLSLTLAVRNPNRRIAFYYDRIEARALYGGNRFGYDASLPLFFQGHKNTTVLSPRFEGRALALGAAKGTYDRERREGAFYVDVKLDARVRLKVMFVKIGHFKPRFVCRLKLPVPPAKAFRRTECDVDWV